MQTKFTPMKILIGLLVLLITTSCTITAHPTTHREHRHGSRVCTREYYDKGYHCKHDHGKHKGHHKHHNKH